MEHTVPDTNVTIRSQMRAKRRALSTSERERAAKVVAEQLLTHPAYVTAQHIGAYIAHAGECDPKHLVAQALADGKAVYMPVLRSQAMVYVAWHQNTAMRKNQHGILEPALDANTPSLHGLNLDVVVMPLLAFKKSGHRLGQGGGHYDRHFAKHHPGCKPTLIGIAHGFQRHEGWQIQPWDVVCDTIVAV